jgi:type IX secretion system PorP/SprF family membrane protein
MSNIDKGNIDEWLFNHFEGDLNLEEQSQLMDFLNAHPELAEDVDMWSNIRVEEPSMEYPNVDDLIREPEEVIPPHQSAGWYTVAAAAMMFLFAGGFLSYIVFSDSNVIPDGWPPVAENVSPFDATSSASFLAENDASTTSSVNAGAENTNGVNGTNNANSNAGAGFGFNTSNEASNNGIGNNDAVGQSTVLALNENGAGKPNGNHPSGTNGAQGADQNAVNEHESFDAPAVNNTSHQNNPTTVENSTIADNGTIRENETLMLPLAESPEGEQLEGAGTNNLDRENGNEIATIQSNDENSDVNTAVAGSANDGGFSAVNRAADLYAEGRFADPEWAKRVLKTYEYIPRSYDALHENAVDGYNPRAKRKSNGSYPAWQLPSQSLAMQNLKEQHFIAANSTPLELNPAFAGDAGMHRVNARYRNSAGPRSMFASYDKSSEKLHGGVGVLASHEILGANSSLTSVSAMYAYRIEIKERGSSRPAKLVIKPAVKMNMTRHVSDQYQDGSFSFNDYGLGLAIHGNGMYGALAVDHLFEPGDRSADLPDGAALMETRFTGQLGTDFRNGAEGEFTLSPHALFESAGGNWAAGAGAAVRYRKMMAGVGYVHNSGARATVGVQTDNFRLGYAFEMPTNRMTNYSFTTHELGIQLLLK